MKNNYEKIEPFCSSCRGWLGWRWFSLRSTYFWKFIGSVWAVFYPVAFKFFINTRSVSTTKEVIRTPTMRKKFHWFYSTWKSFMSFDIISMRLEKPSVSTRLYAYYKEGPRANDVAALGWVGPPHIKMLWNLLIAFTFFDGFISAIITVSFCIAYQFLIDTMSGGALKLIWPGKWTE